MGSLNGWLGTVTVICTMSQCSKMTPLKLTFRKTVWVKSRLVGGSWALNSPFDLFSTLLCWFILSRQAKHTTFVYISGIITEETFPDRHIGPTMRTKWEDRHFTMTTLLPVQCCEVVGCIFPFVCPSSASVPLDFVHRQWSRATRIQNVLSWRCVFLTPWWSCLEAVRHREIQGINSCFSYCEGRFLD